MDLRLFITRNALLGECPKCGKIASLDRMKSKNSFERIFHKIIRHKKYHCKECKWSGALWTFMMSRKPLKVLFNYIILILAAAVFLFIAWVFIRFRLRGKL